MSDEKQEPKSLSENGSGHEPLPAYELTNSGPPIRTDSEASVASPPIASPGAGSIASGREDGPSPAATAAAQFKFSPPPSAAAAAEEGGEEPAPSYTESLPPPPATGENGEGSSSSSSTTPQQRPIAIPRLGEKPTDPFLPRPFLSSYPPSALTYGITPDTWTEFLDALSGFLTATEVGKAKHHAADIAKEIGDMPRSIGKSFMSHARSVGASVNGSAKKGDYVGAAGGVISGTITVPISAAIGILSATVRMPGSAASAVSRKPQTPRQRADAYVTAANKNLFRARGLYAALLDTPELCRLVGVPPPQFLEIARSSKDMSAAGQLASLSGYIADVNVITRDQLHLGENTLWLVVTKG